MSDSLDMDAAIEQVTNLLKSCGIAFVGGFAYAPGKQEDGLVHVRVRACAPDDIDYEAGRILAVNCLNAIMQQANQIAGIADEQTEGGKTVLH